MEFLCTVNPTTQDKLSNRAFVETLESLNRIVADNKTRRTVIVRKDFIDKYFPYGTINSYVGTVERLNPNIIFQFDGYELQSQVDREVLGLIANNLNKDDLTTILQFRSHDFIEALVKLINSYTSKESQELQGASIISSLRETIDRQNARIKELERLLNIETTSKAEVQDKLSVLIKRINYTHNVGVEESMLFRAHTNNYDRVVYIKEITRVQYVDTFVYALQEILRIMYSMPVRLCVIEGYYANGKVSQYQGLKPHYRLTEHDVVSSDILMLGYQPKLFQDIMKNPSNISILIVLDRGGYICPHLFGDNVEYFYTASDTRDVPQDVPRSRIISYDSDTLYIPMIKNFRSLSAADRVHKYSSMNIVKQVIGLLT